MYADGLYHWYSVNRLKYGITFSPILFAFIFMKEKIVKLNKMKKIVGQIRG